MYSVYILYSPKADRFYIGQSEDVNARIDMHKQKCFTGSFTSFTDDWGLFLEIRCSSRTQAILIERHIKRMKSRKYLGDLKKYPEIANKLKEKYL